MSEPTTQALLRGHLEDMERAAENVALLLAEHRHAPLLPPEETLLLWRSKAAASAALAALPTQTNLATNPT